MTSRTRVLIGWAVVVAILLGGAYLIVARNGPTAGSEIPSVYAH
jgi:hypothetical protein